MPAYELTIKAMSMADLDAAVQELAARFPSEPSADLAKAPAGARRAGGKRVAAAAHPPAADEAQALHGAVEGAGEAAGGSGGDGAAVDAGTGAEDQAADEARADAVSDEIVEAGIPEAVGAQEAPAPAGGGEAAAVEVPLEEAERPPAGDGADASAPATIEDLKAAARDMATKKSFDAVKALFEGLGVTKPGQCPPEKIPEAMAQIREALSRL